MLESEIQSKILKHLNKLPDCWAVKVISCNRKGTPDILACINGKFYAFEVKRKGGVLADIQKVQLRRIEEAGGIAKAVYSLDELCDILHKS